MTTHAETVIMITERLRDHFHPVFMKADTDGGRYLNVAIL